KTLAAGEKTGVLTLWDVSTRPRPTRVKQYRPHDKGIYNLVFSPSGNDLVLFGAHTWEHPERGEEEWPSSVAKVCEVATGQEHGALAVYPASDTMIEQAAFAPDGKPLALACGKPYNIAAPEQLRLLDARNLKELASQLIPNGGTWAVAFSPD